MKESPLVFSGTSPRAIIQGRTNHTRRVIRSWPPKIRLLNEVSGDLPFGPLIRAEPGVYQPESNQYGALSVIVNGTSLGVKPDEFEWISPYGKPGDRLWVKETFALSIEDPDTESRDVKDPMLWDTPIYKANWVAGEWERDGRRLSRPPWRSPRFMPRWASRITLEVKGVRVERVQDITEEDAKAEGTEAVSMEDVPRQASWSVRQDFAALWNSIHAKRGHGWDANPWVWVISFEVVDEP